MQSKYKVGLMRLNLLAAALLLALQTGHTALLSSELLLWLAVTWLVVTAALLEFSHRRPATVPWQLLPSLLLAGLLGAEPERYSLWIWLWPVLLMLPQSNTMLLINVVLAGLSWWSLLEVLGVEQALLVGLMLVPLTLAGLARNRRLQPLRMSARQRVRLIPGLSLWPAHQLGEDLCRERDRCRREGVHGELLLLSTTRHQLWPLAHDLCQQTYAFENCYRLDHRTLATVLLHRDDEQARQRRLTLLKGLSEPVKARFIPLDTIDSLEESLRRFHQQHEQVAASAEVSHG